MLTLTLKVTIIFAPSTSDVKYLSGFVKVVGGLLGLHGRANKQALTQKAMKSVKEKAHGTRRALTKRRTMRMKQVIF